MTNVNWRTWFTFSFAAITRNRNGSHIDYFVVTGCLEAIVVTTPSAASIYKVVNVTDFCFSVNSANINSVHLSRAACVLGLCALWELNILFKHMFMKCEIYFKLTQTWILYNYRCSEGTRGLSHVHFLFLFVYAMSISSNRFILNCRKRTGSTPGKTH